MSRNRILLLILLVVGLPLAAGAAVATWALAGVPAPQGDRVRAPGGIVGRQASGAFVWFVPSDSGFVLVDAGLDPTGEAIERERGGRPIVAVLLTHAHADHTAGLSALPGVPVYIGADDRPLLDGDVAPQGWMARWFSVLAPPLDPAPTDVREVTDGQGIEVDGLRFRATHLPGHTPGSTAWLHERVLFTGDAVLGGPEPIVLGPAFTGDPEQAKASLERLLPLDFEVMADGHVGVTTAARAALHRLVGKQDAEPQITLSSEPVTGDGEARTFGGVVEREGRYVQAPVPDPRGQRPAELWLHDGTRWRLSDAPIPEHEAMWGQQVTVRGRPYRDPSGEVVRVTGFELTDIALSGEAEPTEAPLHSVEALQEAGPGWTWLGGELESLHPHAAGARFGLGTLAFPDGSTVAVAMPLQPASGWVGQGVTILARVGAGDGAHPAAARVCPGDAPCGAGDVAPTP